MPRFSLILIDTTMMQEDFDASMSRFVCATICYVHWPSASPRRPRHVTDYLRPAETLRDASRHFRWAAILYIIDAAISRWARLA